MTDVKDILGVSVQQHPAPSSSSPSPSNMAPPPSHVFASPSPPLHPRVKRHSSTASPSPSASSLSSPHHPTLHRSRSTRPSLGTTASASTASSSSAGKVVAPLAPSRLVIPSTGPAQRWVNVPIRSSARRAATGLSHDEVDLLHWVKQRGEADYRFSRFHRRIKLRHYTSEQYEAHLIDPHWTRAETDVLMALCQQYDLRFIVVADRYNEQMAASPDGGRDRTVEELKGRYYGVQCKLLQIQNASDPELRKHPLFTSSYDEEYEKKRKEQLALLYKRRVRDVDDMGQAVLELRKVQNQMKKLKKVAREAREAQRASRGDAGSGSSAAGGTVSLSHKKKKRHTSSSSAASMLLPILDNQLAAIPDSLLPPAALTTPPQLTAQTPFLRSQQFALSVSSLPAKVQKAVLADVAALGVAAVKELVPTAPVWEMWDRVRVGVMQWRAMEQLVEERDKVRDELREEERRKGSAGGGAGEVKREKSMGSTASMGGGGGSGSTAGGDDRKKDKKVKKERRESGMAGDRSDDGSNSSVGLSGDKSEKASVSHKKKDRDSSKRKGGDGDDRDSKRRKK